MQAVLYIGHGSRIKEAAAEACRFMQKGMELVKAPIQEHCFLELSEPDILTGVRRCIERGADKIAVVPVLLLTAAHAKQDIPEVLEKAQALYPRVTFTYGRPLGVHNKIIDILVEKVEERKQITSNMDILLVGRGSSDQDAVNDINTIARLLNQCIPVRSVSTCFLAAAEPKFEDKITEMATKGAENVVILPYLLFTGILMTSIAKTVEKLPLTDKQQFEVCDYLGDHPNLYYLLKQRVVEAIEMSGGLMVSPQG